MAKEEKEKKLLSEDRTDTVIYDSAGNMVESIAITRHPKIVMR